VKRPWSNILTDHVEQNLLYTLNVEFVLQNFNWIDYNLILRMKIKPVSTDGSEVGLKKLNLIQKGPPAVFESPYKVLT